MVDKNQLKTQGLVFGRNLQRAYKIVLLYSPDHAGAQAALQQAYSMLTELLKLSPQFTFGFFNQRVLLNDLLTADPTVAGLQADFSKRNIAALTFQMGITFREFKRGLGLIATKQDVIEAGGGIDAFIRKHPVEGLRILAEEKRHATDGDTVLGMDLQSYLTAQSIFETKPGRKTQALEMLLQVAGMEVPDSLGGSPGEVLEIAGKAAHAALSDPEKDPNEVVQSLARLIEDLSPEYLISALPPEQQERFRGRPPQEIAAELAEDMAVEWAGKRLLEAGSGSGEGTGTGAGPGTGAGSGTGEDGGSGTGGGFGGGTGKTTGSASEKEVARVLSRTLKTTQMAQRLLQKVGALARQSQLPPEMVQRIQEELQWSALTDEERHARLLGMGEFDESKFRRLLDHVAEMGREGNVEKATQASERFLDWLDSASGEGQVAGFSWLPELLQALTGLHTLSFVRTVIERLYPQLAEDPVSDWPRHRALVNSLASAAQCAALFEGFDAALKVGLKLEHFDEQDPAQHADCCRAGLNNLLASRTVERLVELVLQKQTDVSLGRTLAGLARLTAVQTTEVAFQLLEEETAATNRSRLIRLTGQLGKAGLEAARKRLADPRWYVVRNACNILGTLGDPELAAQLRAPLRHSDERVQEAAVAAIAKSKASGREEALAEALPYLQPHAQEAVLNELLLARNPATISLLEDFASLATDSKQGMREKAVQVLATIPETSSVEALGRILGDNLLALSLRRTALNALRGSAVPLAREQLAEFTRRAPSDPLAGECRAASAPKTP